MFSSRQIQMDEWMHWCAHTHKSDVVTTISSSMQAGSKKKELLTLQKNRYLEHRGKQEGKDGPGLLT